MIQPVLIRMHQRDNVAIVGNEGGLPPGTLLPGGATLREKVPQAHKVSLVRADADRSANTSPIVGVVPPGERVTAKGLNFAATPASDFICGTLQLAAAMNLHVFTTGRGTPDGLAACPVIKVATRSELARRWHDLMDLNAGDIADGQASVEEVGWQLFRLMLDVASGRKKTWAEHWKLHNALVLFNRAPVT